MPKVGNKVYSYNKKGKAAAKRARALLRKKKMPKVKPEKAKEKAIKYLIKKRKK